MAYGSCLVDHDVREAMSRMNHRDAELAVVQIAKELVGLWCSPKVQRLCRNERNQRVNATRERFIAAVKKLESK